MSGSGSVIKFVSIGARSRTGKWILQRCGGGTRRRRSGATVRNGEEGPGRCCSRGVCRFFSTGASRLSITAPALFRGVRCAECSTGRRRKHTAQSVGEGFHGERVEICDGRVVD